MKRKTDNYNFLQRIIIAGFTFFFLVLVIFLFRWQVFERDKFSSFAAGRYTESSIKSIRGEIYSRDGETLAYSEPTWDVFVYIPDLEIVEKEIEGQRSAIQTRREFIEKVSLVLDVSPSDIEDKLNSGSLWIKIADKIDYEKVEELKHMPTDAYKDKVYITGLNFEFTSKRIYPEGDLAPHVIGFMGLDHNSNPIGRVGLESYYNGVLESQDGYVSHEKDQFGNTIALSESIFIRPKRGSSIKTTIDNRLQRKLQDKLCEGVEKYQAESGSAVIIDPRTGEILALANCPTFNQEKYYEVKDGNVFSNRAIVVPYEVGSIAKVFTMSAAVEELGIKGSDIIIEGHNGCREIVASNFDERDVRTICTADRKPQGPLTATEALIKSDNLAFVNLSEKLGKQKMHDYLRAFGVGELSGIDLNGESIGYLPELDDEYAWHPVDMAVFAYGHGYQMNLVQATRGIATIANHGYLMKPYVVSEIQHSDGTKKEFKPEALRKVVSDSTAQTVKEMMEELFIEHAKEGYGYLSNYPIAAKSGTALIPLKDQAGYSSDANATYVGFDTSEDSKFIMAIKLEAPQAVEKLSFYSARPLWMETFNEIKDLLGVKPKEETNS